MKYQYTCMLIQMVLPCVYVCTRVGVLQRVTVYACWICKSYRRIWDNWINIPQKPVQTRESGLWRLFCRLQLYYIEAQWKLTCTHMMYVLYLDLTVEELESFSTFQVNCKQFFKMQLRLGFNECGGAKLPAGYALNNADMHYYNVTFGSHYIPTKCFSLKTLIVTKITIWLHESAITYVSVPKCEQSYSVFMWVCVAEKGVIIRIESRHYVCVIVFN